MRQSAAWGLRQQYSSSLPHCADFGLPQSAVAVGAQVGAAAAPIARDAHAAALSVRRWHLVHGDGRCASSALCRPAATAKPPRSLRERPTARAQRRRRETLQGKHTHASCCTLCAVEAHSARWDCASSAVEALAASAQLRRRVASALIILRAFELRRRDGLWRIDCSQGDAACAQHAR